MALTPAYFDTDNVTGQEQKLVGAGGPLVSNSAWLANHAAEHAVMGMFANSGTPVLNTKDIVSTVPSTKKTALVLPNPYPAQSNTPVHPSILYVAEGWNGYKYWLAYTPYPGSNSAYENPSVAASNDLETWVAPATNPIVAAPSVSGAYNSDTCLVFNSDKSRMYLLFRERGPAGQKNTLKCCETTNGTQWTAPVSILEGAVSTQDYACPSAWFDGANWVLITHNLDAASPRPLQRSVSTGSNIYGPYGAATTVIMPEKSTRSWWHSFITRLDSGQVVGLSGDNNGSPGALGDLYWVESADNGQTFQVGNMVDLSAVQYRSSFAVRGDELDILIGSLSGISHFVGKAGRMVATDGFLSKMYAWIASASNLPVTVPWVDSFVREDSAVSLGTASSGGTYTASSGTWGISGNRAYPVASGIVLAESGNINHRVSVQFNGIVTGIQMWLLARVVDTSNRWRCGIVSPAASGVQVLALQNITAGSIAATYTAGQIVQGDTVSVECLGAAIRVYVNGLLVYERVDNAHAAGTKFGMQSNTSATTFFKNLVAEVL